MTQIDLLEEELQKLEVKYISMILEYRKEKRLIFEKYKEVHKQEIMDAYSEGDKDGYPDGSYITGEEYYTSTYGSKGSETKQSLYTKEQLREAFRGFASGKSFEQYYNETYGSKGSETKQ